MSHYSKLQMLVSFISPKLIEKYKNNVKNMMLMLKMLKMLMLKKYINIYKYKLSLFGRDDTKKAKTLIFIAVPQVEQFPKVQKKKKKC